MPTFEVEVRSRLLDGGPRRLRVPAPDEGRARQRGARRLLALAQPELAPSVGAEEFDRVAGTIAQSTTAERVAA